MNQRMAGIPISEYKELAKTFNPVDFDADAIAKLARDAGMKYIVITAKHHDGFAMYESKACDFNIVDATPWGKDPMKDLAAACRNQGLGFGVLLFPTIKTGRFPGAGMVQKWMRMVSLQPSMIILRRNVCLRLGRSQRNTVR